MAPEVSVMSTTVNAVYEDGVFKPEEPVNLQEKAKVRLVIESAEPTTADADDPTGWKAIDRLIGCIEATPPGEAIGRDHDKYLYA